MPETENYYAKFRTQKQRAAQRGIPWKLQFWEWLQIWQDSGHLHERGRRKNEWVMARNGDQGAYEANNIKIVLAQTNNTSAASGRWHTDDPAPGAPSPK